MQRNIGRAERIIRIVIGAGIVSLAFLGPKNPWAWLGLVPMLTGLAGWCPAYRLLKISTREEV
jgi:hypothetical protein